MPTEDLTLDKVAFRVTKGTCKDTVILARNKHEAAHYLKQLREVTIPLPEEDDLEELSVIP